MRPEVEHGDRATQGAQSDHTLDTTQFTGPVDGDSETDTLLTPLELTPALAKPATDTLPVNDTDQLTEPDARFEDEPISDTEPEALSEVDNVAERLTLNDRGGLFDLVSLDDTELDGNVVILIDTDTLTEAVLVAVPLTDPDTLSDWLSLLDDEADTALVADTDMLDELVADTELNEDGVTLGVADALVDTDVLTVVDEVWVLLADTDPLHDWVPLGEEDAIAEEVDD